MTIITTTDDLRPAAGGRLEATSIAALDARLAGTAHGPDDPDYDRLRSAWNLAFEHRPAVVVVPRTTADVAAAVQFAAANDLSVAVQSTGHGVARTADDALLIVMSGLHHVAVDADAGTARIGAGAKWERVLAPAVEAGWAPLLGSTPDVGAVGYTLGGGMGWMSRKYGLSADHVRAIEIVTADGRVRVASPTSEPDLFWALRGAGAGSFGVVTEIEIDLVPVRSMYAGNLLYPASMAREVGARYRSWLADAPDELTSSISFMNFPPLEDVPEPIRGQSFAIVRGAFLGSDEDGAALLDHFRRWHPPAIDLWGRMPFADVALISNDPVDPMPGLSTSAWVRGVSDTVLDVLARALFEQDGPSPLVFAEIRHAGGAIGRSPQHPNAYDQRERQHVLQMVGVAAGPELALLEEFTGRIKAELAGELDRGAYLNFLEGEEKVARTAEAFGAVTLARLRRIKHDVDPTDRFGHGLPLATPPEIPA